MLLVAGPSQLAEAQIAGSDPTAVPTVREGGGEVLALLRGDAAARPTFDPGLAGGLRAWLEDAAYEVVARRGGHLPTLVLGPRQLFGIRDPAPMGRGEGRGEPALLSALVHVLFRQLVHTGEIGDPLPDALGALGAAGRAATADQVECLTPTARAALAESLSVHAANLVALVPRFAPGWLPRTDDRIAIPLAGGRVLLTGVIDLLVGLPRPGRATLGALGLSTGGPWPEERRTLHYLALLETLRNGAPPFRLGLIESGTGRYGVEEVREAHLRAIVSHLSAWLVHDAADV